MTSSLEVVFEVPAKILKGLADGTYERVGGVIRRVDNKQIVLWLSEIMGETSEEDKVPSLLTSPQLLLGMQVANLAVNVAGFAIIYQKIKVVEQKIDEIDQKLDELAKAQDWTDKKYLIEKLTPLAHSLSTLSSLSRLNSEELIKKKLTIADDKLENGRVYFHQVLLRMLEEKLELERPDEFSSCYRAWVLAAQGGIETMAQLGELHEAQARAVSFFEEHTKFGRLYMAARRDPLRKFSRATNGALANQVLSLLSQQCAGAQEIIKGRVLQIEFLNENNLGLESLPAPQYDQSNIGCAMYLVKQ